jgi:hypothetical protein
LKIIIFKTKNLSLWALASYFYVNTTVCTEYILFTGIVCLCRKISALAIMITLYGGGCVFIVLEAQFVQNIVEYAGYKGVSRDIGQSVRSQIHYIRRLCTDRSREAVGIFLFGLEAPFTTVSRAQSSVDL